MILVYSGQKFQSVFGRMDHVSINQTLDGDGFARIEPAFVYGVDDLREVDVVVAESSLFEAELGQSDVERLVCRLKFGMFVRSSLSLTFFASAGLFSR